MVLGKWKAFCMQTMIPGPSIISTLTNTSALHYGLILIQPGSKVTATSSNSTATSSMVTEPKSMVLFRL